MEDTNKADDLGIADANKMNETQIIYINKVSYRKDKQSR